METQYQRNKIQEESLYYEGKKHTGELEIIGVNTYLNPKVISGEYVRPEIELARASYDEKNQQLDRLGGFKKSHAARRDEALKSLVSTVIAGGNVFAELMRTVRHASLGEITETLYRVGGKYRRSM
jgi:methylmalonyl-CoA mutase